MIVLYGNQTHFVQSRRRITLKKKHTFFIGNMNVNTNESHFGQFF